MRKLILLALTCYAIHASAQNDSLMNTKSTDSAKTRLNMDAIYNRPFLVSNKLPVALGGYIEANTQYSGTDGVTEGFSFQMRRLTLFMSSTIAKNIKFLTEIEFEEGTKEINIEFCAADFQFNPLLVFRGGIIMNPIGAYNQNHDGPRWDFIDRPLTATGIIPTTLSNVGAGLHGKYFMHNWIMGYEFYLTNGFDDKVIDNEEGRTSLGAGKSNADKFDVSNSGTPMYTGKVAIRNRQFGEIGISYMRGIYNKFRADGLKIDDKRYATVLAADFNTSLLKNKLNITGEFARVMVDVPSTYTQQYGSKQWGAYTDVIYTLVKRKMLGWNSAQLNVGLRGELVDYNEGVFTETSTNIGDEFWALVPCLAFRPSGTTVIRFNYRFEGATDLFGNPPSRTNTIQLGISSYF
ncbi:MAG: hypothetical protein H6605_04340 [Flavobacteriales bacterium]|nr:hypothetical protein [Flavobacteriales bacterium]